ncbi:MAG: diphosphomevalonate decarboxylase [Verrucomicrobiota bacterium]|jgi:diphosphomevalonate decarboxylase|nr:diphosphomevalonate decarboxylase [Verrucomicrobiota bacterium]
MTPRQVVERLLAGRPCTPRGTAAAAYAPANIALIKYWGKRDEALNLPVTNSLSVSLGPLGSHVELARADASADRVWLNGGELAPDTSFARRASAWLDLVRPAPDFAFALHARNTVPTAAGFASSASGFAALAKAADAFFGWRLCTRQLSILARLGSGSAARSLEDGFVQWQAGTAEDGMDSFAVRLEEEWPAFRVGALVLCATEKPIGSRDGMRRSVETCGFYREWPGRVEMDLTALRAALFRRDMAVLGTVAEGNALAMHALMLAARPPLVYALPETVAAIRRVWAAREAGIGVWFTMDAGPNVKLLFLAEEEERVRGVFPDVDVVAPFVR